MLLLKHVKNSHKISGWTVVFLLSEKIRLVQQKKNQKDMGASKNRGTPKWMVKIMEKTY